MIARYTTAHDFADELRQAVRCQTEESAPPGGPENLLHAIWNCLDGNLQDAFSLARLRLPILRRLTPASSD